MSGGPRLRVVLIANLLIAHHMEVWRRATELGVDLTIVGAASAQGNPVYVQPQGAIPTWAEVEVVQPKGWRSKGHLWWLYPEFSDLVRQRQADLVHVLSEPWGMLVLQALRTGRPVCAHGSSSIYAQGGPLERAVRRGVLRWTFPRLAGFAAATADAMDEARAYGLPSTTPRAVGQHLVPDPGPYRNAHQQRAQHRADFGWGDDDVVIGFAGRLIPEKGVAWLIDSFAALDEPRLRLAIAGSGPQEPVLRARLAPGGGPVEFLGQLPLGRIPGFMAALDVLAVPSLSTTQWVEYFGRVALESMLAATPVVASTCGYLPSLVGDAGMIVAERDRAALAHALARLAEDPEMRRALGARGQQRVQERFHPAGIAQTIIDLWEAIIR